MAIHNVYNQLTDEERAAVDDAFTAAMGELTYCEYPVALDDRAERLVEAIAIYLRDSKR